MFLLVQTFVSVTKTEDCRMARYCSSIKNVYYRFSKFIEIINHTESISNNVKENSESVEEVKTEEEKEYEGSERNFGSVR